MMSDTRFTIHFTLENTKISNLSLSFKMLQKDQFCQIEKSINNLTEVLFVTPFIRFNNIKVSYNYPIRKNSSLTDTTSVRM